MVGYATQDTLRLVVIGLAAIAAISMGAATIESTRDVGANPAQQVLQDDSGGNNRGGAPGEEGTVNGTNIEQEGSANDPVVGEITRCIRFLATAPGGLLYFGAFGGVVYLIKRRYTTGTAILSIYGLMPLALIGYFLNTSCNYAGGGGGPQESQGGGVLGDAATTQLANPDISPIWLAGLFGIILVGAAVVLFRASGDQTVQIEEEEEEGEGEGPDVADLAAAAGAAADRLSEHDANVDNEVYRAWYEMTSLLDVPNPESHTPGEFADAAVEVGMNREDVEELTTLFNEVRYGKRDAESREELALDVFRNIEAAYGESTDATETNNTGTNTGEQ